MEHECSIVYNDEDKRRNLNSKNMIKKIKTFFGFTAKNIWVKNNIYEYGCSCKESRGGSFYIKRDELTCYYNGIMDSNLEQLKKGQKI